jgi:hypothetical protein
LVLQKRAGGRATREEGRVREAEHGEVGTWHATRDDARRSRRALRAGAQGGRAACARAQGAGSAPVGATPRTMHSASNQTRGSRPLAATNALRQIWSASHLASGSSCQLCEMKACERRRAERARG